jgi:16S rRNA processing protein RimM
LWCGGERVEIESMRTVEGRFLVRFSGVHDRTAAEALRGAALEIPVDMRRALGSDEFWPEDLIGMAVFDDGGTERGTVVDVVEGTAQWRLVVAGAGGRVEVPFVVALVPVVDVDSGVIRIADVPGLFDPDD